MRKFHHFQNLLQKNRYYLVILFLVVVIPFIIASYSVQAGNIVLWYDNWRDLLSAWQSLGKPTLIGPISGIPGIFYGPYWIWLLSAGIAVSNDPRVVTFLTATLPYFIIFPLIWFRFSKFFGRGAVIIGWVLFIFGTGMTYAAQLWNLYPAPLFAIASIYLLCILDFTKRSKQSALLALLLGFALGLIINFHISLGSGFFLGTCIFFLWEMLRDFMPKKKHDKINLVLTKLFYVLLTGIGFFIAFIPFLLFEFRHGFHQLSIVVHSLLTYGASHLTGLTKWQKLEEFINTFGKLLKTPQIISIGVLILLVGSLVVLLKRKKITLTPIDRKILALILSLFAGVVFIYFTARNPVWGYHFIGVEILSLMLITFIIAKISLLRTLFGLLAFYIVCLSIFTAITESAKPRQSALDSYFQVVHTITADAGSSEYTVLGFNPSIYAYDYAYLFQWLARKHVPYDPSENPPTPENIYLVVPIQKDGAVVDFIHYRSPEGLYETAKTWKTKFGTEIIKRAKRSSRS